MKSHDRGQSWRGSGFLAEEELSGLPKVCVPLTGQLAFLASQPY